MTTFRIALFGRDLFNPPVLYVEAASLEDMSDRAQDLLFEWPECEGVKISSDDRIVTVVRRRMAKAS